MNGFFASSADNVIDIAAEDVRPRDGKLGGNKRSGRPGTTAKPGTLSAHEFFDLSNGKVGAFSMEPRGTPVAVDGITTPGHPCDANSTHVDIHRKLVHFRYALNGLASKDRLKSEPEVSKDDS